MIEIRREMKNIKYGLIIYIYIMVEEIRVPISTFLESLSSYWVKKGPMP